MPDTHVTIVGNLTDDPEVTFTPNGAAVCNFRLAVTARIKDGDTWKDGDTSFYRITAWRQLAEHVGDSLSKGNRVIVLGQLRARSWETPEGSAAAWSRSRPKRSVPACGGRRPSPSAPPTASRPASSTTTRRSRPGSSEAGAVVTRPGLAHHNPWRP
jgi:single-stranded DNA-binding protein